MCRPLILSGDRSIKPIAASYCSQTVLSISSLDWSNDSKPSFHFPRYAASARPPKSPKHFPQLPFQCVIAVSFFFRVPSHLHVSISSSHHVSFSLFQPFSLWHQCKASIIEWCMGVCVSGIEGLGAPPAPPAEEALTAEHGGLIPPSLLLRPVPHLCWPPSSSNTFSISAFSPSPSIYSLLFGTYWPSLWMLTAFTLIFTFTFVRCSVCFSPVSLCPRSLYRWLWLRSAHYLLVIILCSAGAGQCQCLSTATGAVCFLLMAGEVSPLNTFLFIPAGGTVHMGHSTLKKKSVAILISFTSLRSLRNKWPCVRLIREKGVIISVHIILTKVSER